MEKTDFEEVAQLRDDVPSPPLRVRVNSDYSYDGWLITVFATRSGACRCVVEDNQGYLCIHKLEQVDL